MPKKTVNITTCKMLTGKQTEALDLLVKHKTSKEISRELGISPHTVDQRIETAKRRFGVTTRGELARAYSQLKRQCHELTYEESHIDTSMESKQFPVPELQDVSDTPIDPQRSETLSRKNAVSEYRVGPELLEGQYGTIFRFFAIIGMAISMIILIIVIVSIYVNLSTFVKR